MRIGLWARCFALGEGTFAEERTGCDDAFLSSLWFISSSPLSRRRFSVSGELEAVGGGATKVRSSTRSLFSLRSVFSGTATLPFCLHFRFAIRFTVDCGLGGGACLEVKVGSSILSALKFLSLDSLEGECMVRCEGKPC